jgi:hypothetical protein
MEIQQSGLKKKVLLLVILSVVIVSLGMNWADFVQGLQEGWGAGR